MSDVQVNTESAGVVEREQGLLRRLEERASELVPRREQETTQPRRRARMKEVVLVAADGQVVCERCYVADRPLQRVQGLIGWRLAAAEGMLLRPAWSIHTAFVRFPIDAVFLDEKLTVISIARLKPWRVAWERRARSVLELPGGRSELLGVQPGDTLGWGLV
jgi:uncharacterized membrane protein (UPF0127 family)